MHSSLFILCVQEVLSQFKKSFQWGVKVPVKSAQQARSVKPALGWPRVQVLERTADDASPWKVLKVKNTYLHNLVQEIL